MADLQANIIAAGWIWWLIFTSPIYLGAIIGVARPAGLIAAVERAGDWLECRRIASAGRGGFSLITRPVYWCIQRVHQSTESIQNPANRAGLRTMICFYIIGAAAFLTYVAVMVVVALIVIGVIAMVVSKILGSTTDVSPKASWIPHVETPKTRPKPPPEPDPPPPKREGHPSQIINRERQHCQCRHGCPTSAIITEWACKCTEVDIRFDVAPGSDCSRFSERRWHCEDVGRPYEV